MEANNSVRVHALPRHAAPQLSAFHRGTTHIAYRHVDADDRAALAGLSTDAFRGVAGRFWICEPGADAVSFLVWRVCGGPLRPASRGDCHADDYHASGVCAGGVDGGAFDWQKELERDRVSGWARQCVLRAAPAVVF